ncbi:MAG: ABC transporter substrate-binding protein [Methanospirillum sp.]
MNRNLGAVALVAVLVLAGFGAWYASSPPPGPLEPLAVGNLPYEYSGLVFIADEQGFFARNGLNVTFTDYVSTVASVKGMEKNETAIALTTEFSIVTEAFDGQQIDVIGTIDRYQAVSLLCRRDRGIENVSDLRGRRIGASHGTIGEFYLGRFLELHGIPPVAVTLVDLPTSQYVDAVANGSVDAVVVVQRYLEEGRQRLGSAQVAWPIQSGQQGYVALACRDDWAASHPETIEKFLGSLKLAGEYVVSNPSEARAIVQRRVEYTDATMDAIWSDHLFSLSLDQSFVAAMQDEARWMIANNLTNATAVPDFTRYISTRGLAAVDPPAVRIIGVPAGGRAP